MLADAAKNFMRCQICHGKYGEKPMASRNAPNTLSRETIVYSLTNYRDKFDLVSGNVKQMATNVKNYSNQDIEEIADYIVKINEERENEEREAKADVAAEQKTRKN